MSDGLNPGGVMVKAAAIMLDGFGLFCFFLSAGGDPSLGMSLSFIPDILGIFFLGGPRLMKKKASGSKKNKRFLLTVIGEVSPLLGDILPFWSISAWKQKK